jgi:hypothetical protein
VPYLLGGALAVAVWGEPRATADIDLVIALPQELVEPLSVELQKRDILLSPDLLRQQLAEIRGDLAIVAYHVPTTIKIELFPLRPNDPLRASALERRELVELDPPIEFVYVHTAEDLILYKLKYFDISEQPKHSRDIISILIVWGDRIDYAYLTGWIAKLHLGRHWRAMAREALVLGAAVPREHVEL